MLTEMIERIKGIILFPAKEWAKISKEDTNLLKLLITWVLPLLGITLVASMIGNTLASFSNLSIGIAEGIALVIFALAVLCVMAFIACILAPIFGGGGGFCRAFTLVAYAMTPAWLAGVFYVIPNFGAPIVLLVTLYSFYIMYLGITPMMSVSKSKALVYLIILVIAYAVVFVVLSLVLKLPLMIFICGIYDKESARALSMLAALKAFL
jgi:hypothetical protein